MQTLSKGILIFATLACMSLATSPAMAFYYGTPEEKLHRLFLPHLFYGGVITPDIKAATGDPNIPVIDWRKFGDISTCNYIYQRGPFEGRVLMCQ